MSSIRNFFESIEKILPSVNPPKKKISLTERLIWTLLALVIYMLMSEIFLYGLPIRPQPGTTSPIILNIIFASRIGTLMTLGIGPIVTAGIIVQLLAGAELIKLDLSKPEDRSLFTSLSKLLAILITVFQSAAYVLTGYFGSISFQTSLLIFIQLFLATMLVMLLDEMVQKGWGLGSGISLFIAAGVAQTIFWDLLSPIEISNETPKFFGVILALFETFSSGVSIDKVLYRGNFPDLIGLLSTIFLILLLIYLESVRIEIPISYAKYGSYRAKYPVKLLYVSNIPVIFASTIFANVYYLTSIVWSKFNPNNDNILFNILGKYTQTEGGQPNPIGGLAYYMTSPRNLASVMEDPLRAIIYLLLMISFSVVFAIFWVEVGGLSANKVAEQLIDAGMQVPGFRRNPIIISKIIEKHIYIVTILGGLIIGIIAGVADLINVFGSGVGILLMIGILFQYYELLTKEQLLEMYPSLGKLLE
ncbi:MAG: preprotein translocase subunit SecY [Nitrososphaerota archaeon]